MKTKALLAALAAAAWAGNAAASVIATNSATSVSNGLVVVDYLVDGELDSPAGHIMQVVATDPSTGREYYKAYPGTKYCLAGAHCVVWNFTNEVSAANPDDAAFRVEFVTNAPAYSVVELSGGTNAVCFPVGYLEGVPDGGWTFEHKTSKLVMRRCEAGEFKMGGWSNEWAWVCKKSHHDASWEYYEGVFYEDPLTLISALIDCFDQNGWPESMHALHEEMEILTYYQYEGGGRPDLERLLEEYGWPHRLDLFEDAADFMCGTPRYHVTLTRPFYCSVFEFTEEQYKYVMGNYRDRPAWGLKYSRNLDDPLRFISFGGIRGEDRGQKWPIDKSVDEASLMGVIRQKTRCMGYDLPTAAQWEYACRAGTSTVYSNGNGERLEEICAPETARVGTLQPNTWGLYDMHGGVFEWCLDQLWWIPEFKYSSYLVDPVGPLSPDGQWSGAINWRVSRGAWGIPSGFFGAYNPLSGNSNTGLRIVCTVYDDVRLCGECESVVKGGDRTVEIISSLETAPFSSVVETIYRLDGQWLDVQLGSLAFQDGVQSWARVIPMESTTVPGPGCIAWRASEDWNVERGRVAVSILAKNHDLLPFEFREAPLGDGGKMVYSCNSVREDDVIHALYWLYANHDDGLYLENGVLSANGIVVAENNYLVDFEAAFRFVVSRMRGPFSVLEGPSLELVNDASGEFLQTAGHHLYVCAPLALTEELEHAKEWGVSVSMADIIDLDMSGFEPSRYCFVDGDQTELFYSRWSGNRSDDFGTNVCPAVKDFDGDGLFDVIVASTSGIRVYLNVGTPGSPAFATAAPASLGMAELSDFVASMDRPFLSPSQSGLYVSDGAGEVHEFSVESGEIVSCGTNGPPIEIDGQLQVLQADGFLDILIPDGESEVPCMDIPVDQGLFPASFGEDLLVSDSNGAIWYFEKVGLHKYELRSKSFAGTYPGFASGLTVAAVDWEDDGDLDCLCGTADGKLMLLRDPKVGKPSNLAAETGINSVSLTWDPNRQSRIRHYRVYRAESESAESESWIAEPKLPAWRDMPPQTAATYDYGVSSVSRFYTAGNSTPTIVESPKAILLSATLGGVTLSLRDAAGFAGEEVDAGLAVNNSLGLAASGMELAIEFDPAVLSPVEAVPAGLGATLEISSSVDATAGVWTIRATGGEIAAGAGALLTLRFAAAEGVEGDATIALTTAQLRATSGQTATAPTPVTGTVSLQLRTGSGGLVVAPWSKGDVDGNGKLERADLERLRVLLDYAGYSGHGGHGNGHGGPGQHQSIATERELRAGDMNENGKLEEGDYQLLYKFLKSKGAIP